MALQPINVGDYRSAGSNVCGAEQWKWKYDPAMKQGKWILAEPKAERKEAEAPERRPRVTMAELEEDQRKAAEKRAADLRRETKMRMQRKQMLAAKKEQEEEDRRQRLLEQRRAEIEEKRQLMNAGARVKTSDICFDEIEPAAPSFDIGEGVMRPGKPPLKEKPGWNSSVGPGSGPPRVGYQPASLIPPPALPPSRSQRNASGAGLTQNTRGHFRRRSNSAALTPSEHEVAGGGAHSVQGKQKQGNHEQINIDDVLSRADRGIKQARMFSAAAAADAYSRPESASSSAYSAAGGSAMPASHPCFHNPHDGAGMQSGRTSPSSAAPSSLKFWNNMAPCSEGGGIHSVAATPRSAAGSAPGGGCYRRKVDALREEIDSLKRVSTAASVASNASRTSTATASSSRTAYSTSSKLARRYADPGGGGGGGEGGGCPGHFSLAKSSRGSSAASSRYGSPPLPAPAAQYPRACRAASNGTDASGQRLHAGKHACSSMFGSPPPPLEVHENGPSRVRGGLAAARAQAALLDSLDLDSPAHRNNAKAEVCLRHFGDQDMDEQHLRQSLALVESLDLPADAAGASGGGGLLKGLNRADQWLKRAVDSALGANAQPPRAPRVPRAPGAMKPPAHARSMQPLPPSSAAAREGAGSGRNGGGGCAGAGRDVEGRRGVQFGKATVKTREVAGRRLGGSAGKPPGSGACVLRKSAELLKKQASDTEHLLREYREYRGTGEYRKQNGPPQQCWAQVGGAAQREEQQQEQSGCAQQWARFERPQAELIEEQIREVDEEEALLMASLARLDGKLADATDPAAAYVAATEYRHKQQALQEAEEARRREERAAPMAHRKLPPAPALDHWNRNEDMQQFRMQQARDDGCQVPKGAYDCGGWGITAQSGRRPGMIQRVERVVASKGLGAKDRRALLKNK